MNEALVLLAMTDRRIETVIGLCAETGLTLYQVLLALRGLLQRHDVVPLAPGRYAPRERHA